jgi:hypothetical protein
MADADAYRYTTQDPNVYQDSLETPADNGPDRRGLNFA